MSYSETLKVLSKFYEDVSNFWICEGKDFRRAIGDIEKLKNDPFDPMGRILNEDAKRDFLNFIYQL